MDEIIRSNRDFMKGYFVEDFDDPANDFNSSDQQKGVKPPPLQKGGDERYGPAVSLPEFNESILMEPNILKIMRQRRSRRRFSEMPLSLRELSYLLWATQGVKQVDQNGVWALRTVPSAGARHPYETYLIVNRVNDLDSRVYLYLPLTHQVVPVPCGPDLRKRVYQASYKEKFVADAPVCFVWSCIPYRGEWRYNRKSHKSMLLDAGHICHSLYLASESVGCGTCAIGGYYQSGFDDLLGLDGENEFVVYLAAVGKVK